MRRLLSIMITICLLFSIVNVSIAEITDEEKLKIIQRKEELDQTISFSDNYEAFLYASSSDKITATDNDPIEKRFCADFTVSLEKRWNLVSNSPTRMNREEQVKTYSKLVQTELDNIKKYSNAKFSDPWLGLLAKVYLKGLATQMYALDNYKIGTDDFTDIWQHDGAEPRAIAIYLIFNYYNIKINRVFSDSVKDMWTRGKALLTNDLVDYLFDYVNDDKYSDDAENTNEGAPQSSNTGRINPDPVDIEFITAEKANDTLIIKLSVKNNQSQAIKATTLNLCITDDSGNTIKTAHTQNLERIKSGKSMFFEFQIDADPEVYAIYVDNVSYDDNNGQYQQCYLDNTEEFILKDKITEITTEGAKATPSNDEASNLSGSKLVTSIKTSSEAASICRGERIALNKLFYAYPETAGNRTLDLKITYDDKAVDMYTDPACVYIEKDTIIDKNGKETYSGPTLAFLQGGTYIITATTIDGSNISTSQKIRVSNKDTGIKIYYFHYREQGKELSVAFDIENNTSNDIRNLEIVVYACDKNQNDLYNGEKYTISTSNQLNPYRTIRTQSIKLPKGNEIATIYAGIRKIEYKNEKTIELDYIDYSRFDR